MLNISKLELEDFSDVIDKNTILSIAKSAHFAHEVDAPNNNDFTEIKDTSPESEFINISPFEIEEIKKAEFQKGYDQAKTESAKELSEFKKNYYSLQTLAETKFQQLIDSELLNKNQAQEIFSQILIMSLNTIWDQHKFSKEHIENFIVEIAGKISPSSSLIISLSAHAYDFFQSAILEKPINVKPHLEWVKNENLDDSECIINWDNGHAKLSIEEIKNQTLDAIKQYFSNAK